MYGFPFEVRLFAAELVAKGSGRRVPLERRIPHCASVGSRTSQSFGRSPLGGRAREFLAERLRFGKVTVADREVISLGQLRR